MSTNSIKMLGNLCRLKFLLNCRFFSTFNREIVKPGVTSVTLASDILLQNLKNATNSQGILELVGSHHKIMNSKQLMQALRSLFTLQKYGNSTLSTQQIMQHPDFERLCYHLKLQAGMIELNETIEALKVISYVGVSTKSSIAQVLLQLIRQNVNDLSLHQIIFLDFLLKQFKSSPLVDGLLIALPIVFEVYLPTKMDRQNVGHLAEYLQYISKKRVSDSCIELIVHNLIKCIDQGGQLDPRIANSIIWSICDMEANAFFKELYEKAMNALVSQTDQLEHRDLQTTLSKIVYKHSFYYNEAFVDNCANYIIEHDLGFEEAVFTLSKLTRINHLHTALLDYLSQKCQEYPEVIEFASGIQWYTIVTSLALTDYRPRCFMFMREAIANTDCFTNYEKNDILWLKLAASLCSLDIYKHDVLSRAFDKNYITQVFKQPYLNDVECLLLVYQAISTFREDLVHFLPSSTIIEAAIAKLKPVTEYPLEMALQNGLGGENYIKTCIKSKLGHHIDHVVVMRKGGFPVSLQKNIRFIEDIDAPADSFVNVILGLNSLHYTLNTKHLKGTSVLMAKTLEAKGYIAFPICLDVWESLEDFERIPYLMQAIRIKNEYCMQLSNRIS